MTNNKRGVLYLVAILIVCAFLFWLYAGRRQSTQEGITQSSPKSIATQSSTPAIQSSTPAIQSSPPAPVTSVPPVSDHDHLQHYVSRLFSKPVQMDGENEQFTIVMMTYKRVTILPRVLDHYCKTPLLDKIIMLWNNVEEAVPNELLKLNLSCAVPLLFIKSKENRLTNRFKARPEIKTDCVVTIDDDRIVGHDDLVVGFRTWQQFRHRLVGFEHRTHSLLPDGTYHYGTDPRVKYRGYSMMIGATIIMHRVYLEMFFDPEVLPRVMFEYIDNTMNCEDVGICVMVTKFLEDISWPQCGVLAVKNREGIKHLPGGNEGNYRGLSQRSDHYQGRSACLNKFREFYNGTLHLHHTFREIKL